MFDFLFDSIGDFLFTATHAIDNAVTRASCAVDYGVTSAAVGVASIIPEKKEKKVEVEKPEEKKEIPSVPVKKETPKAEPVKEEKKEETPKAEESKVEPDKSGSTAQIVSVKPNSEGEETIKQQGAPQKVKVPYTLPNGQLIELEVVIPDFSAFIEQHETPLQVVKEEDVVEGFKILNQDPKQGPKTK